MPPGRWRPPNNKFAPLRVAPRSRHQPSPLYVNNNIKNHNNSRRRTPPRLPARYVRPLNVVIVVESILIPEDVRRALHLAIIVESAPNVTSVNVVDETAKAKLKEQPPLSKTSTKIYAYGSDVPMTTLSVFNAEIATKRKVTEARVYVMKGKCGSLLSFKTVSNLTY
jgi:hypothetical protein